MLCANKKKNIFTLCFYLEWNALRLFYFQLWLLCKIVSNFQESQAELKEKTQSLEHTINSLNQQLHKAEVTLQLKESMFLRKETDLKHSVKLLQNEIKDLNERLDTDPDDLNQSQSSMIFKKIVDMSSPQGENGDLNLSALMNQIESYKEMQGKWSKREKELVSLLKETSNKLKTMKDAAKGCDCALEENRSVLNTPSQRRIKGKNEEKLEDALELSKQKVASLISRNEQLENQFTEAKETFQRLKNDLKDEVCTLRQENDRCEKDFLNEKNIMEEKHNLEIEKILLVEEVRLVSGKENEYGFFEVKMLNNWAFPEKLYPSPLLRILIFF